MTDPATPVPVLSVIVAIYNVRPYLPALLASLLSSARTDFEYIFVDDHSQDGSAEIAEMACAGRANCRVHRLAANQGVSGARNAGLAQATGRYIWFIDGDDAVAPDGQDMVARAIETSDADVVAFDFVKVVERDAYVSLPEGGSDLVASAVLLVEDRGERSFPAFAPLTSRREILDAMILDSKYYAWCVVVKRELAELSPFPVGRYFEDISVTPLWLVFCRSVYYVADVVMLYRQRPTSILGAMTPEKLLDFGQALGLAYRSTPVTSLPPDDPCRDALLAAWLRLVSSATSELILDGWLAKPGVRAAIKATIADLRRAIGDRLPFVLTLLRRAGQRRVAFAAPVLFGNFALFEVLFRIRWSMPVRRLLAAPDDTLAQRRARMSALSGQDQPARLRGHGI